MVLVLVLAQDSHAQIQHQNGEKNINYANFNCKDIPTQKYEFINFRLTDKVSHLKLDTTRNAQRPS